MQTRKPVRAALMLAPAILLAHVAWAQTFTTLASFGGADGAYSSYASLLQGLDGNFYGTTNYGGANGDGTVFSISPGGALSAFHSFDISDGNYPAAALVQATDGSF